MRTFLRERFNDYLKIKVKYLSETQSQILEQGQILDKNFDIEVIKKLEEEVRKILHHC